MKILIKSILYLIKSDKGSVMLEFVLVLPLYLLIFGGTFLIFDLSMGKLHLQEANRNLAWMQNDRYDGDEKLINKALYKNIVSFYQNRNQLESSIGAEPIWSFGENYSKYKKDEGEPPLWGHQIKTIKEGDSSVKANNDWCTLYSGNMELKMEKLSGVYIGAVGVSSVLFPNNEKKALYQSAYSLTRRIKVDKNKNEIPHEANGEMLLVRRTKIDTPENNKSINNILNIDLITIYGIIFRKWPAPDDDIGTARTILGI